MYDFITQALYRLFAQFNNLKYFLFQNLSDTKVQDSLLSTFVINRFLRCLKLVSTTLPRWFLPSWLSVFYIWHDLTIILIVNFIIYRWTYYVQYLRYFVNIRFTFNLTYMQNIKTIVTKQNKIWVLTDLWVVMTRMLQSAQESRLIPCLKQSVGK